jgi:hypothetical protein
MLAGFFEAFTRKPLKKLGDIGVAVSKFAILLRNLKRVSKFDPYGNRTVLGRTRKERKLGG